MTRHGPVLAAALALLFAAPATADDDACEFGVMIADGWRGAGLASGLMRALIRDARARGLKRMEGYVLAENTPMLDLARRLGFEVGASDEGRSVKRVRLDLANTVQP